MMYVNKMAGCLKAKGRVLREFKDTVYIPFGSEYSIFLKNLNTVRAQVLIEIDGVSVTEGNHLIIDPRSEFELTRFIKNGNLNTGNRFKFIERTANIENHRGVGIEDGLIRVEFQFEKVKPKIVETHEHHYHHHHDFYRPYWRYDSYGPIYCNSLNEVYDSSLRGATKCATTTLGNSVTTSSANINTVAFASNAMGEVPMAASAFNDVGITVPGSVSNQQFRTVQGFDVETETHVMIFKLLGETDAGKVVKQAVVVQRNVECPTCGRKNKQNAKFCSECGTGLEIV